MTHKSRKEIHHKIPSRSCAYMVDGANDLNMCFKSLAGNKEFSSARLLVISKHVEFIYSSF